MTKKNSALKSLKAAGYFSYRRKDFVALLMILVVWALISYILQPATTLAEFIISFSIMAILTTFAALLIRKCGIVLIMLVTGALVIRSLPDLNGLGIKATIAMLLASLLFEILYLILYIEVKTIPFDVILSIAVSFASIPVWTGLTLSTELVKERFIDILNLVLLDFFIGLVSAAIAFLFWFIVRTHKTFVRFECTA